MNKRIVDNAFIDNIFHYQRNVVILLNGKRVVIWNTRGSLTNIALVEFSLYIPRIYMRWIIDENVVAEPKVSNEEGETRVALIQRVQREVKEISEVIFLRQYPLVLPSRYIIASFFSLHTEAWADGNWHVCDSRKARCSYGKSGRTWSANAIKESS